MTGTSRLDVGRASVSLNTCLVMMPSVSPAACRAWGASVGQMRSRCPAYAPWRRVRAARWVAWRVNIGVRSGVRGPLAPPHPSRGRGAALSRPPSWCRGRGRRAPGRPAAWRGRYLIVIVCAVARLTLPWSSRSTDHQVSRCSRTCTSVAARGASTAADKLDGADRCVGF